MTVVNPADPAGGGGFDPTGGLGGGFGGGGFGGGGFAAGADVAGGMVGAPAGPNGASTDHFADHLPAVTGDHLPADDHRPAVHHPDASVLGHEMGMPDTGRMPDAVRLSDAVRMSDDRWMPDSRWMPQPCLRRRRLPRRAASAGFNLT